MSVERVVIYVRVSRATEVSTSLARQEAACRAFAAARGWAVARVFTDSDVSGGTQPEQRPGLGALLERLATFDVLLVWRADRLARSLVHFSEVVGMCHRGAVRLVTVDDGWDMSTSHGRFAANVLASFAEFERELCRERAHSARSHLQKSGRWTGGRVPYGLCAVPNPHGPGKVLMRDERAVPMIRELATRVIAGEAPTRIAADFQARGIPAPRVHNSTQEEPLPSAWSHKSIKIVLSSQTLLGHKMEHRTGRPITRDGQPAEFWPPVITKEEFDSVSRAFEDGYQPRRPNRPAHWLSGVVSCGICGRNMKRSESSGAETLRCRGPLAGPHPGVSIKSSLLVDWLDSELADRLGRAPVVEHIYEPEHDFAEEIARLRRYTEDLLADRRAGVFATPEAVATFRSEYEATVRRLASCEASPVRAGGWTARPDGRLFGDVWGRWTLEERGNYLLGCGVRVTVHPPERPRSRVPAGERCRCDLGVLSSFDARPAARE